MPSTFPELPESTLRRLERLGVQPEEVEESFIRGTGPGGQKINKTSSTVRVRHGPTGLEARSQQGRSQADNRAAAWARLAERLEERKQATAAQARQARELERRRTRQKSARQKARQVADKLHRAGHKANRRRVGREE